MYKLSIIIPIYNVENYLEECLDSVRNQTEKGFEVILVNDGSDDNSGVIAKRYADENDNVKLIVQENKGLSEARNEGIKIAEGEYLIFLDSDDYLEKETISLLLDIVTRHKLDLLLFAGRKKYYTDCMLVKQEHFGYQHDILDGASGLEVYEALQRNEDYYSCVVLQCVKRSLLNEHNIRFYPNILHEDHLYTFQVFMAAENCGVISKELYNYRYREGSIMTLKTVGYSRNFIGMNISYQKMLDWYFQYALRNPFNKYRSSILKHLHDMRKWTQWYYDLLSVEERESMIDEKEAYDAACRKFRESNPYKVSIIIPAFNVEQYLEECLESILSQKFNDYEIIIIDDGSTDRTKDIAKLYAKKYNSIISLYEQNNLGPSGARNTGLNVAEGEYILYIDSDDYINKGTIQRLIELIEMNSLDTLLFSCKRVIMDGGNIESASHWGYCKEDLRGKPGIEIMAELLPTKSLYDVVWLQFVKRELIEKNGIRFYPGIIHEDHLYTFSVLLKSKACGYITEELYNYRIREKSIMTTKGRNLERFIGWAVTFCELIRLYKEENIEQSYPLCNQAIRDYIWFCGVFALKLNIRKEFLEERQICVRYYKKMLYYMLKFNRGKEYWKIIKYVINRVLMSPINCFRRIIRQKGE